MYCQKCGHEINDKVTYCEKCGIGKGIGKEETQMKYAGFWERFGAYFIDVLVMLIPSMILGFIIGFTMAYDDPYVSDFEIDMAVNIFSILIWWIYHGAFESSSYHATPGKMALGLVVTDLKGERLSFGTASGRYFAMLISGLILCIGFIMIAFTSKKQGLHDIMAGCLVIKK